MEQKYQTMEEGEGGKREKEEGKGEEGRGEW